METVQKEVTQLNQVISDMIKNGNKRGSSKERVKQLEREVSGLRKRVKQQESSQQTFGGMIRNKSQEKDITPKPERGETRVMTMDLSTYVPPSIDYQQLNQSETIDPVYSHVDESSIS